MLTIFFTTATEQHSITSTSRQGHNTTQRSCCSLHTIDREDQLGGDNYRCAAGSSPTKRCPVRRTRTLFPQPDRTGPGTRIRAMPVPCFVSSSSQEKALEKVVEVVTVVWDVSPNRSFDRNRVFHGKMIDLIPRKVPTLLKRHSPNASLFF